MNYINAEQLGKDMLMEVSLMITPDEAIQTINEFVYKAVDKDLSGKQKFEWVIKEVLAMAVSVWELILPLVVQALYEAMMASTGRTNGK